MDAWLEEYVERVMDEQEYRSGVFFPRRLKHRDSVLARFFGHFA